MTTKKDLTQKLSYEEINNEILQLVDHLEKETNEKGKRQKDFIHSLFQLRANYIKNSEKYKKEEREIISDKFNNMNSLISDYLRIQYF